MAPDAPFRAGAGRLCLDLIRTLRYRGRDGEQEEIPTAGRWDAWLRQFGLDSEPDLDPRRDKHARALREHIAGLLTAVVDEGFAAVQPADRAAVNSAASRPVPAPQLSSSGTLYRVTARPGEAVRALLARDALELAARPGLSRLRRCADPGCRTIFLDASRPGMRRWCAMSGCGDRSKKSQQRARRAPSATPTH